MLNFLPSSISFYIILTLSILLAVVSTISVKLYRAKIEAESALVLAIDTNTEMVKASNLQKMSCDVNDTSVVELDKEKKVIQVSVDVIDKELAEMKTVKKTGKQETIQNEKSSVGKQATTLVILPDDGLLSANLVGLLHRAYCNTEQDDYSCTARQPSN